MAESKDRGPWTTAWAWPCLLDRQVLKEAGRLLVFYLSAYLAVLAFALAAPLVAGGANVLDVLVALPQQLAFPASIVGPMALVTALLLCLGRMRADGELTALRAAGIPPSRVLVALLPVVLLLTLGTAVLAHGALADAYRNFGEARSGLLRQAIATRVAREEPLFSRWGSSLTALHAQGGQLYEVCGRIREDDGSFLVAHAPQARWVATGGEGAVVLRLQLLDLRGFHITPRPDGEAEVACLDFPSLVLDLEPEARDWARKADAMPSSTLADGIPRLEELVTALGDPTRDPGPVLRAALSEPSSEPVAVATGDDAALGVPGVYAAASPVTLAALRARLAGVAAVDALDAVLLDLGAQLGEARRFGRWTGEGGTVSEDLRAALVRTAIREWRAQQFAWHLRWVLAVSPLALALFAAGLALRVGAGNRLLAVLLSLGVVLVAVLPAFALVKGLRGNLPLDPAWLLWPPQALIAGMGLCWCRKGPA